MIDKFSFPRKQKMSVVNNVIAFMILACYYNNLKFLTNLYELGAGWTSCFNCFNI